MLQDRAPHLLQLCHEPGGQRLVDVAPQVFLDRNAVQPGHLLVETQKAQLPVHGEKADRGVGVDIGELLELQPEAFLAFPQRLYVILHRLGHAVEDPAQLGQLVVAPFTKDPGSEVT